MPCTCTIKKRYIHSFIGWDLFRVREPTEKSFYRWRGRAQGQKKSFHINLQAGRCRSGLVSSEQQEPFAWAPPPQLVASGWEARAGREWYEIIELISQHQPYTVPTLTTCRPLDYVGECVLPLAGFLFCFVLFAAARCFAFSLSRPIWWRAACYEAPGVSIRCRKARHARLGTPPPRETFWRKVFAVENSVKYVQECYALPVRSRKYRYHTPTAPAAARVRHWERRGH